MRKTHLFILSFLAGFSSLTMQVLVYRELLAQFQGNELTIGIMLGFWLLWGGHGSSWTSRLRTTRVTAWLSGCLLAMSIVNPGTLIALKSIRFLFGLTPGEITGLTPVLISCALIQAPCCWLQGCMFGLLVRNAHPLSGIRQAETLVYVWEGAGALIASILHRMIFVKYQIPLSTVFSISLLLVFSRYLCPNARTALQSVLSAGIAILVGIFFYRSPVMELYFDSLAFPGFILRGNIETPYSRIYLAERTGETSLFSNGSLVVSSSDLQTAEERSHIPLALHPTPRNVLVLESGPGLMLDEIQKHPVGRIDMVLLDRQMLDLLQKMPGTHIPIQGPETRIYFEDPYRFVTSCPDDSYDVVISCTGEPTSFYQARFRSLQFYRSIRRILKAGGIFSMQIQASETFLSPIQAEYIGVNAKTLQTAFPEGSVDIIPGDIAALLAFKNGRNREIQSGDILTNLKDRGIDAFFISENYLPYRMNPFNLKAFRDHIIEEKSRVSTQYNPVVFRAALALWASHFSKYTLNLFFLDAYPFIMILLVWAGIQWLYLAKCSPGHPVFIYLGIASVGSAQIVLELILIMILQLHSGTAYLKTGMLIGCFHAGLTAGGWISTRIDRGSILSSAGAGLLQLILSLLVLLISAGMHFQIDFSEYLLDVAAACSGLIGGLHFGILSRLQPERTGMIYGVDLLGSSAGAMLVSTVLLTQYGLPAILLLTAAIPALASVGLIRGYRGQSQR